MTRAKRPTRKGGPVVLGLVRVSTDEQAESGAGLAAQAVTLHAEAAREGWALELVPEEGVSGKDMNKRPVLIETLRRLDAGEADVLAVAKLDRLSRSVIDFATILDRAKRGGWSVVALDLGVDTSTPTGELVAGVMMQVAQWERRIIAERTRDSMAAAKQAKGLRYGRPDALDPALRVWVVQARGTGRSYQSIADELNARGFPTAHGGRKWHASTVRAVMASQGAVEIHAKESVTC